MKKIKALLKSKAGMTFVELLTALALLVIIIASFTPMLLNSYETLYKAGERNEKTYQAKSSMEKELAERDSKYLSRYSLDFDVKLEEVTQLIFLNMRKAMETVQNGIQTVFYGGKGTIRVVSPSTIPDDEPTKEITILFNGINVTKTVVGNSAQATREKNETTGEWEYQVAIQVIPPELGSTTGDDKTAFDPSHALSANDCKVSQPVIKEGKSYSDITVSGNIDVLTTVLKIVAYYKDENNELNSAEAYVRITPATIMMVGETKGDISYYTSKGVNKKTLVVEKKDGNGNIVKDETGQTVYENILQTEFQAYGRPLRDTNIPAGGKTYKTANIGTEFLSVNYIDTDNATNIEPYYVLTGTNGVIQRLFIAQGSVDGVSSVTGYGTSDIRSIEYKDGGLTKKLYPAFWGGDKSHQFGFTTYEGRSAYENSCWYTGNVDTAIGYPEYDIYSIQSRMSMYFSGWSTSYDEIPKNGRKISFVLVEKGCALRLVGARPSGWTSFDGFITTWESPGSTGEPTEDTATLESLGGSSSISDTKKVVRVKRLGEDKIKDNHLSYLNLKAYNDTKVSDLFNTNENVRRLNENESSNINVTAAIYNENLGRMMYLGTTVANAYLQQLDNVKSSNDHAKKYSISLFNQPSAPAGGLTGYLIAGKEGGGATMYKVCAEDGNTHFLRESLSRAATGNGTGVSDESYVNKNSTSFLYTYENKDGDDDVQGRNATYFYGERTYHPSDSGKYKDSSKNSVFVIENNDLAFTLGYSSNRELVYSDITYSMVNRAEAYDSYARFFYKSHVGSDRRVGMDTETNTSSWQYKMMNEASYINNSNNDMYNVWFPGEFYNLTQTATKEGITVAVGYTVSGSTFQRFHQNGNNEVTNNSGTALGGVFNDGVLSVLTSDNSEFKNLLYYKDYENFENTSLTTNTKFKDKENKFTYQNDNAYGSGASYGTHARKSVRFTAVDICVDGGDKDIGENEGNVIQTQRDKTYYAVYGDNQGRVYISKIASVSMPSIDIGNPNNPGEDGVGSNNPAGTGNLVTGIKDLATSNTKGTDKDPNAGYKDAEMNEMLDTNDKRLSEHFSEITSIFVDEQTIYVTGRGNGTKDPMIAVCNINESFKFTVITLVHNAASYNINDMMVLGGFLYCAGEETNRNIGFWIAIDTKDIDRCLEEGYDSIADIAKIKMGMVKPGTDGKINKAQIDSIADNTINPAVYPEVMPYQELATPINSIAGRNT